MKPAVNDWSKLDGQELPELHGLESLGERVRQLKICLWAPVDIQSIMPSGDRRLIEGAARNMIRLFGRPDGAHRRELR